MKKRRLRMACGIIGGGAVAAMLVVASLGARASGEDDVHLVDMMSALQTFMHKTGLSLHAGNLELADFYLHETEEVLSEVGTIESYDGQPVGLLSAEMLGPAIHELEEAVDGESPEAARAAYQVVLEACNACHLATGFGFIKVVDKSTENPYMQSFER